MYTDKCSEGLCFHLISMYFLCTISNKAYTATPRELGRGETKCSLQVQRTGIRTVTGSEPVGDSGSDKAPKNFEFNSVHLFHLATWQFQINSSVPCKCTFSCNLFFSINMEVALAPEVLVTIGENTRRRILYN